MGYGQSIANIRTQYSIPANISDSEVMKFAQENNITIDFSAKPNTQQAQGKPQSGGWFASVFGPSANQGTEFTPNSGNNNFAGTNTGATSSSVFGNGYFGGNNSGDITGFTLERTTTPVPQQQQQVIDTTTFAEWQRKKEVDRANDSKVLVVRPGGEEQPTTGVDILKAGRLDSPQQANLTNLVPQQPSPQVNGARISTEDILNGRADAALADIFGDEAFQIQNKEIKDGRCLVTLQDGRIVEVGLQQGDEGFSAAQTRSDIGYKIYENGRVTTVYEDGRTEERKAVNGEQGYVKDGEAFDERLARFFDMSVDRFNELSTDEKKEYARRYTEEFLGGKSAGVRKGDYIKLLRNTPPDSENGRLLISLAQTTFKDDAEYIAAIKEVYGTRLTDEAVAATTDEVTTNGRIQGMEAEDQLAATTVVAGHIRTESNVSNYGNMTRELHVENQGAAVRMGYENLQDNAELMDAYRNDVTNNLPNYHKDAQVDVARTSLEYDDEEHTGAQNMADHAHETDADVQKEIAQMLLDLQVDSVSGKIASHAYEYDLNNRDDIIQMVKDHGTEGAKQILEEAARQFEEEAARAEQKAEEQRIANERQREAEEAAARAREQEAAQNKKTDTPQTQQKKIVRSYDGTNNPVASSTGIKSVKSMIGTASASQIVSSSEFKSLNTKERIETLKEMNTTDKKAAIKTIVERSEGVELQGYMFSEMKNAIIKYLVSNPSPKNNSKLQYIERYLNADDKRYMQDLKEEQERINPLLQSQVRNPFSFGG